MQAKLPHLAMSLGHANVISTHYYLKLTPELRQAAAKRYHDRFSTLSPREVTSEGRPFFNLEPGFAWSFHGLPPATASHKPAHHSKLSGKQKTFTPVCGWLKCRPKLP